MAPDSGATASKGQDVQSKLAEAFERFKRERTPKVWAEICRLCPDVTVQKVNIQKYMGGLAVGSYDPEELFAKLGWAGWSGYAVRDTEALQPGEQIHRLLDTVVLDRSVVKALCNIAVVAAEARIRVMPIGPDKKKAQDELEAARAVLGDLANKNAIDQAQIKRLAELSGLSGLLPRPPTKK